MYGTRVCAVAILLCLECGSSWGQVDYTKAKSIYDFTATDIYGKEVSLDKYRVSNQKRQHCLSCLFL